VVPLSARLAPITRAPHRAAHAGNRKPQIHYVWTHWLNVPAEFFLRATRYGSRWYPHSVIGMRARLRRTCRHHLPATGRCGLGQKRCPMQLDADTPAALTMTHLPRQNRSSRTVVDLTLQHTNHTVLVEGPEISVRPVGTRRLGAGGSR
jgi:hypothetical protein